MKTFKSLEENREYLYDPGVEKFFLKNNFNEKKINMMEHICLKFLNNSRNHYNIKR